MVSTYEKNLGKTDENMKVTKPQDIVRLYDIIIQVGNFYEGNSEELFFCLCFQNYGDISAIPAVKSDEALMKDNAVHVVYFNAFRSFYISIFYLNNKKYKDNCDEYE